MLICLLRQNSSEEIFPRDGSVCKEKRIEMISSFGIYIQINEHALGFREITDSALATQINSISTDDDVALNNINITISSVQGCIAIVEISAPNPNKSDEFERGENGEFNFR